MSAVKERVRLLKAGELAKLTGVLVSTIRYYTKIGLLNPDDTTPGNYNLYEERKAVKCLKQIDNLKKKRYTLDEILANLSGKKI